jgi:lactate dehydrogenase-like 2-hydroxyacid dehydrogenase
VARLLKAFNVDVIVANSDGKARVDEGVCGPAVRIGPQLILISTSCGALATRMVRPRSKESYWLTFSGSLPSAYYSTNNTRAFKEFLSRSDILIASLPSTPKTRCLLGIEHLSQFFALY